jgi:hypothetical protein
VAPQLTAHRVDPTRRPHLARLRAIVRSRMWKWLFDAHRLLGITVEVLDDQFALLAASREGRLVRDRFTRAHVDPLRLLAEAGTLEAPLVVGEGAIRIACAPIVGAGVFAGAVLVNTDEDAPLSDGEMIQLAALLADTIVDQLSRSTGEHRGTLHQISALYQLLHTAIATGSEREVIRTFAEALSIWEEVEVLAYRADLTGHYHLSTALPGSERADVPATLDADPAPAGPRVTRLAAIERGQAGFGSSGETMLARLDTDGGRWLVALNAPRVLLGLERAQLYAAALGHALNGCVAVETSRLTWAVMQRFVDRDTPQEAAGRALEELRRALSAAARFTIFGPEGSVMLSTGDPVRGDRAASGARALRAAIAAPAPFTASLEVYAAARPPFTPRDAKLFEAAAGSFAAWLPSGLRKIGVGERRSLARSFDQIVERYAREAHASQDAASLILVSTGDRAPSLDTTHAWIKRLRPQLRPTDLAGRLASGELGILLLQTPQAGAQVVARRLSRMLAPRAPGVDPAVRIGVASQLGDFVSAEALIAHARAHAVDQFGPPS